MKYDMLWIQRSTTEADGASIGGTYGQSIFTSRLGFIHKLLNAFNQMPVFFSLIELAQHKKEYKPLG